MKRLTECFYRATLRTVNWEKQFTRDGILKCIRTKSEIVYFRWREMHNRCARNFKKLQIILSMLDGYRKRPFI